ncbi:Uncharacterised protein [Enterocloster clostridioformis]|uniref:Uncharacterized protein n=1 Tax=Enterocloster clostridioformis TaxID=1531 RepID=A0A2X2UQU7_9FIRM|nr:Uncharacterised protein [Enterocloster clostridioformis]
MAEETRAVGRMVPLSFLYSALFNPCNKPVRRGTGGSCMKESVS